jgi:hypothetical protein
MGKSEISDNEQKRVIPWTSNELSLTLKEYYQQVFYPS